MPLVHRTNYEGREILASKCRKDKDLKGLDVIWTQYSTSKIKATCCFGFGSRKVFLHKGAFLFNENDNIDWNLHLVTEHEGHSDDHYFYKFVLIPSGKRNFGRKTCVQRHNWEFVGVIPVDSSDDENSPIRELGDLLKPYYHGDEYNGDGSIERYHVHVGVCIESLIAHGP